MSGAHRADERRSELRGETCGSVHPEQHEVVCDKHLPCFGKHSSVAHQTSWDGRPVPNRKSRTIEMTRIANESSRRKT